MKVKVTDMREFLTRVEECVGDVCLVYPKGGTESLKGNFMRQSELADEWHAKGQCLTIVLDVEARRDQRRLKRFAVQ